MNDTTELRRRLRVAMVRGVTNIGEDALGEAQRRAPVDEGTLRGSGEVEIVEGPNEVTAVVSFNTVYAARQHEELDWDHPKGGQAKYLESVVKERAPRYEGILAAEARRAMAGGR